MTGTFSGVTIASPVFIPSLVYGPNDVFLVLRPHFTGAGGSSNQQNVAAQLDSITNPTAAEIALLSSIGLLPTLEQIRNALSQLSGEQYTSFLSLSELSGRRFIRELYDPLRYNALYTDCWYAFTNDIATWFDFQGGRRLQRGDHNAEGFAGYYYDFAFGAQKYFEGNWTVGTGISYEFNRLAYRLGGDSVWNTIQAALYWMYNDPLYYALSDIIFGWSNVGISRRIHFGSTDLTSSGSTNLFQGIVYGEVGVNLHSECILIQPFIGLEAGYYGFNGITESGAGVANLTIASHAVGSTFSRVGVHITPELPQCILWDGFYWSLDVAWLHRFRYADDNILVTFQEFGSPFFIDGILQNRSGFEGAIQLALPIRDIYTLWLEFSGEHWGRFQSMAGTFGVEVLW